MHVVSLPLNKNEGVSMKQTKQEKYFNGLESKGMKKVCVIIPAQGEAEIKKHAMQLRKAHLKGEVK